MADNGNVGESEMINNMNAALVSSCYSAMVLPVQQDEAFPAAETAAAAERDRQRRRRGRAGSRRVSGNLLGRRPARTPRVPIVPPASVPPRVIDPFKTRFLFEKQLQNSDVSAAGRIVIPKKLAEEHLPTLRAKEGIWLDLDDMDYFRVWTLKFRYWPNNNSRMYVLENTKEFVATYQLAVDDYIMICRDDDQGSYVISTRKSDASGSTSTPVVDYMDKNLQRFPRRIVPQAPVVTNGYGNWMMNNNEAVGLGNSSYLPTPSQMGFTGTAADAAQPSASFNHQPLPQFPTSDLTNFSFFD